MFNQQASVEKLKREIEKVVTERFPLVLHGGYEIIAENIRFTEPASDLDAQTKAFVNESTLEMPVKMDLVVKKDGEVAGWVDRCPHAGFPIAVELDR